MVYVLLGVNAQGSMPAMSIIVCETPEGALVQARSWLLDHPSCVRVQVWREPDTLVAEVGRDTHSVSMFPAKD